MTEQVKYIVGAKPGEPIDWDGDPRIQTLQPQPIEALGEVPTVRYEYGARDPDNHSKINIHPSYELALDASKWWAIDHKVYVRQVGAWAVLDD
jgi:hypothetical protein